THHAERQLIEPVGGIKPADGAFKITCYLLSYQQIYLHHAARQRGRHSDTHQLPHLASPARAHGPHALSGTGGGNQTSAICATPAKGMVQTSAVGTSPPLQT